MQLVAAEVNSELVEGVGMKCTDGCISLWNTEKNQMDSCMVKKCNEVFLTESRWWLYGIIVKAFQLFLYACKVL